VRQGGRLYVAKVGELRVRWSRALPSAPSSGTIIRDPDGRYYASFVVERPAIPLPPVDRVAGIDLGLCVFAAVVASDGSTETVPNPRHLRAAERRLARVQRQLSRKRDGSANRAKARHRVAVAHRRVRDRRADQHHKLALRLLRENQAVAVEDLAVAGLARTRLAKGVHDAGWAMVVRLLKEKAAHHGRRVIRIGRFEPTSQTCSACGHRDGPKPLDVRLWTCGVCGATHDRDVNAARNILVAAGLAETQTPVEPVSARQQWRQSATKQEPTEVPHERHGRIPTVHGGEEVNSSTQATHQAGGSGAGAGCQPPWGRMAGAEPCRVLSLVVAPTRRWWATPPSGLETRPRLQATQAVGRTCSSSASWRISAAG
jgi:IS605 OrfB family transposase